MKVRDFVADSFAQAFARIRQEMGPDAYIVATRTIRRSWPWPRSAGAPARVVVTAALPPAAKDLGSNVAGSPQPGSWSQRPSRPAEDAANGPASMVQAEAGSLEKEVEKEDVRPSPGPGWLERLQQAGWREEIISWLEKEWQRQAAVLDPDDWSHCVRPWLKEELISRVTTSPPWLDLPDQALLVVALGAKGSGKEGVGRQVTDSYRQIVGWRTCPVQLSLGDVEQGRWQPTARSRRLHDLIWVELPDLDALTPPQASAWVRQVRSWHPDEIHWVISAARAAEADSLWQLAAPFAPTHLTVTDAQQPGDSIFAYEQAWKTGLALRFLGRHRPGGTGEESQDLEIVDGAELVETMIAEVEAGSGKPSEIRREV
ncbi:MAG: hypothetical protein IMX01_02360 [Limnochordaceae bacterium]|nr:hypothetical protein [Limnochordaceae bacterium]